ncbi:MAG: BREX-1 system adenine-specific DNA-methyltransferase PglX [Ignavibacteriaceae bacterium]|nr:BREX-1 system adenine-specific DNA-methyltransferase PglX [Ignavibacteriaceae bacterium]
MDSVSTKIDYILTHHNNVTELLAKKSQVDALIREIETAGKAQITEKTAYTIFNRLVALRFMDVKGYNFVPLVSPYQGSTEPAILTDAKTGIFHPDFPADYPLIKKLVTGSIQNAANPFAEAYKLLFIGVCGYFNTLMPFMFEPLNSYTEILLPDDLLSPGSILALVNENIGEEECANVEVIGWLYQFYISEKKDEVSNKIKSNKSLTEKEITAYTQLFTPRWIVDYLVENSLGRLWLEHNAASGLLSKMRYFLNKENLKHSSLKIETPEEIRILDPSCGSGHILISCFDLLISIYEENGYATDIIPELILKHNLVGIDLDERAAKLTSFALMMKAREKDPSILKKKIEPLVLSLDFRTENLSDFKERYGIYFEEIDKLPVVGSLFKFKDINLFSESFDSDKIKNDLFQIHDRNMKEYLEYVKKVFNIHFHCVITNPPYINPGTNPVLRDYVLNHYPNTKSDLYACFIEKCFEMTFQYGYVSMVTMQSWMFLSSFEKLRTNLISNNELVTLGHFDNNVMGIAFGISAFIFRKGILGELIAGDYFKVSINDLDDSGQLNNLFRLKTFNYHQSNFSKIPGAPIAYWVSKEIMNNFNHSKSLNEIGVCKTGISTGNNEKFLRLWHELQITSIALSNNEKTDQTKWFPTEKGGDFRKYFGNNEFVMNWQNNGSEIRNFYDETGYLKSRPQNTEYFFETGLVFSSISSQGFSVRFSSNSMTCTNAAKKIFLFDESKYLILLGLLNTSVITFYLKLISPTMNFESGDVLKLPIIFSNANEELVKKFAKECKRISKQDWDSREISWDFKSTPLLVTDHSGSIENAYKQYTEYWREKFFELHRNEEELNRIFIEIYGLEDELTPEVELKDVTILQQEKVITENGELRFKTDEVMRQFISYSVGCMMGRYSPDAEGLILANSGESINDFLSRIPAPRFMPDDDGIIPVLSEELFSDDIVSRFMTFLGVVFGEQNVYPNLHFIENAISKNIRSYFYTDFYKDHVKRYKKRPIYWMVSSPQKTFQALIYMHRYHEETLPGVLNNYLIPFAAKLRGKQNDLFRIINDTSATDREKNEAEKTLQALNLKMRETDDFIVTMKKAAEQKISIDLDDGVKVNISKFNGIIIQV